MHTKLQTHQVSLQLCVHSLETLECWEVLENWECACMYMLEKLAVSQNLGMQWKLEVFQSCTRLKTSNFTGFGYAMKIGCLPEL